MVYFRKTGESINKHSRTNKAYQPLDAKEVSKNDNIEGVM